MRNLSLEDRRQVGGGVEALPGTVVTRAVMMGSWLPWTYAVGSFAGGFVVGTYIYDNFGTEILDGIEAVAS